jgi:hypothetical protein
MANNPVLDDFRYKEGLRCMKKEEYETAIEIFSALAEECGGKYGDDALEVAPVFFHFANALLMKEEEASSKDLLGGGTVANKAANMIDRDEQSGSSGSSSATAAEEGSNSNGGAQG